MDLAILTDADPHDLSARVTPAWRRRRRGDVSVYTYIWGTPRS